MKYLIIFILAIQTSYACKLSIPESYIPTFLNPPVSGAYEDCESKPQESCYCVETVNPYYSDFIQGSKTFVVNLSKKSAHESSLSGMVQLEEAKEIVRKSQACGRDTISLMLIRNASKSLTDSQKVQLYQATQTIVGMLDVGSLDAAKSLIQSTSADGVLITESDKTALAANVDGCKP